MMQIYLLYPTEEGIEYQGYDCYDSHVVIANSPEEARGMVPTGDEIDDCKDYWTRPDLIMIEEIGQTHYDSEPHVVLSSFNAG